MSIVGKHNAVLRLDDTDIDNFNGDVLSSCQLFHNFWFSWKDRNYRFGTGLTPFENEILSGQDPKSRYLVALHFGNANSGQLTEWLFDEHAGMCFLLQMLLIILLSQLLFTMAVKNTGGKGQKRSTSH